MNLPQVSLGANVENRQIAELLLAGENRVLSMLVNRHPLHKVLEEICLLVEEVAPGCLASILLLDSRTNRFCVRVAPSFPESYIQQIGFDDVSEMWGPCSTAAHLKIPVIVSDIRQVPDANDDSTAHHYSAEYRDLALAHNLFACWSTPFLSSTGHVLGTFGVSFYQVIAEPSPQLQHLIDQITHLTTVTVERSQIEERLRLSEACLSEAQRLSLTGSYWWNTLTGAVTWSDQAYRIYEFSPALKPSLELARLRLHPDDRELFETTVDEALQQNSDFVFEHRLLMPDGRVKHVRLVGRALKDESGQPLEHFGAVMDVTAEKSAQLDLENGLRNTRELKARFRLALDTIPGLVWTALPGGEIDYLNQRWCEYTGLTLEQARGWGWLTAIYPHDLDALEHYWRGILQKGEPGETEARLRRHDGILRWFLFRAVPLFDDQGNLLHWYGQTTDIDDRKRAEAVLSGEKRLLEMVATGDDLHGILEKLCGIVEENDPGMLCGIVLAGDGGVRLQHGAAPSLPTAYNESIHDRPIGPDSGPCATAIYTGAQVVVTDCALETRWQSYRWCELALANGLRACWSTPIFSCSGKVLGSLALYSRSPGLPSAHQLECIARYVHMASIAIERRNAEDALRGSEQFARGQVAALSSTLNALAQEPALDKLIEHVLRTMAEQLGAHSNSVWMRQEQGDLVEFAFAFEDGRLVTSADPVLAPISPTAAVEDIWPWQVVFGTGKPFVLDDIREEHRFPWRQHLLDMGVTTIIIVPMMMADRVEGVIGIRFTEKRTFRSEEMELAQALTNQAMLAMQLTRLSVRSREAAIMEERNRMARDIHDTLAQGLTGVIVQMEAASDAISRGLLNEVEGHLGCAGDLARESLHEARRSVQALRPRALQDKSLCEALREMMEKMTGGTTLQTDFDLLGQALSLPYDWDGNILHIGQEALTNAIRHARAECFRAQMNFGLHELQLSFSDDGNGFDTNSRHDGFGLLGIKERVASMQGQVMVETGIGKGTTISISLPLPDNL